MSFEYFSNGTITKLAADITDAQTTLTVLLASGFPSPNFRINIENELMLVTGVSGTTFTVTRGIEGTVAIAHVSATQVTQIITAGALDTRFSQMIVEDTFADPTILVPTYSSVINGRLIINKAGYLFYDNGMSFEGWSGLYPINYNLISSLTNIEGSGVITVDPTGAYLSHNNTSSGSDDYTFYSGLFGSDTWIISRFFLCLLANPSANDYYSGGIFMMNSGTLHRITLGIKIDTTGIPYLESYDISDTTINSTYYSQVISDRSFYWAGMKISGGSLSMYLLDENKNSVNLGSHWGSADLTGFDSYGIFLNARIGNVANRFAYLSSGSGALPIV
jgi:hypothetical protein